MNSLVQQLYHIPAFSSGLLSITNDKTNESSSYLDLNKSFDAGDSVANKDINNNSIIQSSHSYDINTDNDIEAEVDVEVEVGNSTLSNVKTAPTDDEKFLFQLQVMFGYLRLSEKRFYDTMSFCKVRIYVKMFIVILC